MGISDLTHLGTVVENLKDGLLAALGQYFYFFRNSWMLQEVYVCPTVINNYTIEECEVFHR